MKLPSWFARDELNKGGLDIDPRSADNSFEMRTMLILPRCFLSILKQEPSRIRRSRSPHPPREK